MVEISHNHTTSDTSNNTPVNRAYIQQLYHHGVIDASGYQFAIKTLFPSQQWALWMMRLAIGLGTSLLLIGILFFFAYNWQDMSMLSKFSLIQGAMILSVIGAWWVGFHHLLGQCLIVSASVLIGVFFAVFGQIFQTGADAWQLFAVWAVLMLGFIAVSRSPIQWVLQWVVTGVALYFWLGQAIHWGNYDWRSAGIPAILTFYTAGVWGMQMLMQQRWSWLQSTWLYRVVVMVVFILALLTFCMALFTEHGVFALIAVCVVGGFFWWYYTRQADLLLQILSITAWTLMAWIYSCYHVVNNMWGDEIAAVALMLLITIGLTLVAFKLTMGLKHRHEQVVEG